VPWNCLWGCGCHCSISDGQWRPNFWCLSISTTLRKCCKRICKSCFIVSLWPYDNTIL
jgi:hypothetical protein